MDQKFRRLFIALPVDNPKAIEALKDIYTGLDRYRSLLKTVNPLNLHITMKFLGNVDEDKSAEIISSFNSPDFNGKIDYCLKGIGAFPSAAAPSVIWGGIDCEMEKISDLFSRVENFCLSHGFEKETRRFSPHLTIARVKRGREIPDGLKDFIRSNRERIYAKSVFNRIVLFESKLDKEGPEYIKIAEVKLN